MKRSLVAALCGVGLLAVACSSSPTPDPDNGVSTASYRLALGRTETNVAGVYSKLAILREADLASPKPAHSPEWWDAQLGLIVDTRELCHETLLGASQ